MPQPYNIQYDSDSHKQPVMFPSNCRSQSLVGSMVSMLEQSESTKRYAMVIRQLLPVVTKVYAAEDPQEAVNTLVSSVLGPYLEKVINSNWCEKNKSF